MNLDLYWQCLIGLLWSYLGWIHYHNSSSLLNGMFCKEVNLKLSCSPWIYICWCYICISNNVWVVCCYCYAIGHWVHWNILWVQYIYLNWLARLQSWWVLNVLNCECKPIKWVNQLNLSSKFKINPDCIACLNIRI